MKFRKIVAFCAAMAVCAAVTACGEKEVSSEPETPTKATSASAEPDTEPATETVTEAPTEAEGYEYYKLFKEEWESGNACLMNCRNLSNSRACRSGDKIYIMRKDGIEDALHLGIYDLSTKKYKDVSDESESMAFCNGKIYDEYFLEAEGVRMINRRDGDGNVEATLRGLYYIDRIFATSTGAVAVRGSNYKYRYAAPDFKEMAAFPPLMLPAEHGLEKEAEDIRILALDGNKVYVSGGIDTGIYCFDVTDPDAGYVKIRDEENMNGGEFYSVFGKYCTVDRGVWNVVTGERYGEKSSSTLTLQNYPCGAENHYFLEKGKWYRVKTENGRVDNFANYTPLGEETGSGEKILVDDTYYIYMDSAGMFLRTYEKGESEEETICLF